MNSTLKVLMKIFVVWFILIFFEVIQRIFTSEILRFLSPIYMITISLVFTHFEKKSITKRFGFTRSYSLVIIWIFLFLLSLFIISFNFDFLQMVLIAPFVEELFFRGYLLGNLFDDRISNQNNFYFDHLLVVFISFLFAVSHFIVYFPDFSLFVWMQIGSILAGSLIFGLFYMWRKTIFFGYIFHLIYNFYAPSRSLILVFSIVLFCASFLGLSKRLKNFKPKILNSSKL